MTTDFTSRETANAVAIQGDGKIVAAGSTGVPGTTDFALARYIANGSLDTAFDGDGTVSTDFGGGGDDQVHGVAIQGDGKIVAVGFAAGAGTSFDFAVARYNTDGALDTTFDVDGKVTTDFAGSIDQAFGMALQGDGKIVAAGWAGIPFSSDHDFALARYNTDGSLDTTFDGDGMVTTDFASSLDQARGVALLGDGSIVVAGFTLPSGDFEFALARYNTDGSLDPAFDGDGKVTTDIAGSDDQAFAVAIQGDGKIVAAGHNNVSSMNDDFALARYNANGSLDTTFDVDGKVTTDLAGSVDLANGVAIQANGKIVAVGRADVATESLNFGLARYNIDGSLDPTFSADGKVTTNFAGLSNDIAFAVAIQANGRIVAAGSTDVSGTDEDFALARYTCVRRTSRAMSIPICP